MFGPPPTSDETTTDAATTADERGDCDTFEDEAPGPAGSVEIHNLGTEPILLSELCAGLEYVRMSNADGWIWPLPPCTGTCSGGFHGGCDTCGTQYTVVEPGNHSTLAWPGLLYDAVEPPAACLSRGSAAPCRQAGDTIAGTDRGDGRRGVVRRLRRGRTESGPLSMPRRIRRDQVPHPRIPALMGTIAFMIGAELTPVLAGIAVATVGVLVVGVATMQGGPGQAETSSDR